MSHIDFFVGFILIISTLFLIIYFISNSLSNITNDFKTNEIKESSLSLERYLFEINNDNSLITTARKLPGILTESNNTDHREEIRISMRPQVNKVKVYDDFIYEIPSSSNQLSGETILSFSLSFTSKERKNIKVIYFGDPLESVNYLSDQNNITLRILSDKELGIVSQERCSKLKSNSLDDIKEIFGFNHQFKLDLDDCNYGSEPPISANVFLRNIPVILESPDGLLRAKIARLRVW